MGGDKVEYIHLDVLWRKWGTVVFIVSVLFGEKKHEKRNKKWKSEIYKRRTMKRTRSTRD